MMARRSGSLIALQPPISARVRAQPVQKLRVGSSPHRLTQGEETAAGRDSPDGGGWDGHMACR